MFFKHFGSKNQLPGLSLIGTLVENGLIFLEGINILELLDGGSHQRKKGGFETMFCRMWLGMSSQAQT